MIRHIWLTPTGDWRSQILRIYWDGSDAPTVECPLGDFFACGWGQYAQVSSLAVCVNPGSAFNSYWEMPFRKGARFTLENRSAQCITIYDQITYTVQPVEEDAGYFHAQFRRVNPLPYKQNYTILDGICGCGQYVGTYMAWGVNNTGWWGEGEIKFYMDGDREYPTICGTGTEDYFCGSYNLDPSVSDLYDALFRSVPGDPSGWRIMLRRHASACIAGILQIRSTLRRNSASRFRHWAGAAAGVIRRYRTISRRSPISTLIGLPARFRPSVLPTSSKSSDLR